MFLFSSGVKSGNPEGVFGPLESCNIHSQKGTRLRYFNVGKDVAGMTAFFYYPEFDLKGRDTNMESTNESTGEIEGNDVENR